MSNKNSFITCEKVSKVKWELNFIFKSMFFLLNLLGMCKKFLNVTRCKNLFHTPRLNFHEKWRGVGPEALANIAVFWIFALFPLSFACFLTTAGDYNRWRVHLHVSLQLISSFFQFFTPAPWPPFWAHLRTPLTVGTFFSNKTFEVFLRNCVKLLRCRIVHSTLHCRAEDSCILEPNKFQKFRRWRRT